MQDLLRRIGESRLQADVRRVVDVLQIFRDRTRNSTVLMVAASAVEVMRLSVTD